MTATLNPRHYRELDLPTGIQQCIRCTILIGDGHQPASTRNPRICKWCEDEIDESESETKESFKMSDSRLGITEDRVAQWAEWRREGKSYTWISEHDELGPTYPTIKSHLEKNGYSPDGDQLNGDAPAETPDVDLPEGWGAIETDVLPPNTATGKYGPLIKYVRAIISTSWARMEAPSDGAGSYFGRQLRDHIPNIETANRKIGDVQYLYFRINPKKEK